MASHIAKILIFAAVGAAVYASRPYWQQAAAVAHLGQDPAQTALLVEADRQGIRDSLEARFRGISSPAEVQAATRAMVQHGIGRLAPEELVERASLLYYLDTHASDSLCARRFIGTIPPEAMPAYLASFDSAQKSRWLAITVAALKADLLANEPPELATPSQVRETLTALEATASAGDKYRLDNILSDPEHASIEDQCWASKTLTSLSLGLPEPARASALRIIARIEAVEYRHQGAT